MTTSTATPTLVEEPSVLTAPPEGRPPGLLRRLVRDHTAMIGLALLALILAAVLAAPWLSPFDPITDDQRLGLSGPSLEHPLGTDPLGRDVLSRLLHGGRASIATALAAAAGISLLGVVLGVCSGMLGRRADSLIMRVVEVLQALPLLIVAMVAVGLLGGGADKLVLTVVLLGWPAYARVVRAATLSVRERGFVDAARAQGASRSRIMARHIVPNLLGPVSALSTVDLGRIVLVLSALSFLGFGVRPPNPEWGAMLADARPSFFLAPRLLLCPGAAISLLVFAVHLFGDGFRDAIDGKVGSREIR